MSSPDFSKVGRPTWRGQACPLLPNLPETGRLSGVSLSRLQPGFGPAFRANPKWLDSRISPKLPLESRRRWFPGMGTTPGKSPAAASKGRPHPGRYASFGRACLARRDSELLRSQAEMWAKREFRSSPRGAGPRPAQWRNPVLPAGRSGTCLTTSSQRFPLDQKFGDSSRHCLMRAPLCDSSKRRHEWRRCRRDSPRHASDP